MDHVLKLKSSSHSTPTQPQKRLLPIGVGVECQKMEWEDGGMEGGSQN